MDLKIDVSSKVQSFEIVEKIEEAIRVFFPDWNNNKESYTKEKFPSKRDEFVILGKIESLDIFFDGLRKQKILDTAFDAMTINLDDNKTSFSISRQSALSGKISFILGDRTLGGTIDISLERDDLGDWLEQETWHNGRNEVPRFFGDELSMNSDGIPSDWFEED